jgi:membrane fusion protein, multidrug efflux system
MDESHSVTTPPRRRRWLGSVIAILCLVALGSLAWYLTHQPKVATASGAGALARKADIPVVIEALGTVTPAANVTVRPQVSGVITQVLFKEGQMVKKGDLLATIDPQSFQMALTQAIGARQRDEAQLEAARVTLQRYRTLLEQDSIARQDVDTQAALVKQLEGTVTIDRANEGTARLSVGYARIVAPVSGRVGLRPIDAGNYIGAGDTTGIAVITQIAPIDVAFAIPQDRVPEIQSRLAEGAQLTVGAWDRARTKQLDTGSFSTLDNQVDTATGTVKAKARFANAGGALFPNQFVNVKLLLRTIAGAVVVPVTALRHGPSGDFVYVVAEDKTVTLRNVTRGEAGVDNVMIAKGLDLGEQVVTEGGDRLKEGAKVQTSVDRPAGAASGASAPGRRASGARGERGERGASRPAS